MLNLLGASSGSLRTALAMIRQHHQFLVNNTGVTDDATTQRFALNPDGVLSNNRHFIASTQMEYQPNGDATTEGQALLILGYCYAYYATKQADYLEAAVHAWDAYVAHFYAGQAIPQKPQRWICNWLVNGKEPVLSNWPINSQEPTHGGYKCVPLRFVNGVAKIPHGSPFWGEYLDVLTFAHRGHMAWAAINGGVQRIANQIDWDLVYDQYRVTTMPADPTDPKAWVDWDAYLGPDAYAVDWRTDELELPASSIVVWTRNRIGIGKGPDDQLWDGDIIESGLPLSEVGTVQLANRSINGVYFVNYAVRLPVEHGGYLFKRNEVWHNRPVHTPLPGSVNQMGNASDAEQWFADACLLLWQITKEDRYRRALYACLYTCYEYAHIDAYDKFFRISKSAQTPFTDGISYDFYYPSETKVDYSRTEDGYVKMVVDRSAQVSLEQQSIWFRVTPESLLSVDFGGVGINGAPVAAEVQVTLSPNKQTTEDQPWSLTLPLSVSAVPRARTIELSSLTRRQSAKNTGHIPASSSRVDWYGPVTISVGFAEDVINGSSGPTIDTLIANDDGGVMIEVVPAQIITSIVYKSNGDTNIRIIDDNGWRWWWMLDDTGGAWVEKQLDFDDLTLSGYQPGHSDDPRPDAPVITSMNELLILLDTSSQTNVSWSYLGLNGLPVVQETYIMADMRAVVTYGAAAAFQTFGNEIVDGRSGACVEAEIYNSSGGVIIGHWLLDAGRAPINSIVYKSTGDTNLRITDKQGWRWYWLMPNTGDRWVEKVLSPADLILGSYQPINPDGTLTPPTTAVYDDPDQLVVVLDDGSMTNISWSYYCINEKPPTYDLPDAYTMRFRITLSCGEPFTAYLGDCTALEVRDDPLAYTPGVIPFSNIYAEGTDQISSWRGMPYPGYQYPLIYCLDNTGNNTHRRHMENMVNFLYDAQLAYQSMIGELGPVASAYIWNRWDNFKYGAPDQFTMYHWGDGKAWSGYQPRAFQGACRLWQELVARGQSVPPKLVTYCENWIRWLVGYVERNHGTTPTDFPSNRPAVYVEDDFTGHMCGLWLAGAVMAAMAGSKVQGLDFLIETCVKELQDNYVVTGVPGHPMDGAWSPAVRLSTGNGMYFGFWGGEIMRGLGLYAIYKQNGPVADFYRL